MKRLINYLIYKLSNRLNIVVLIFLIIYNFFVFRNILYKKMQFNIYDIIIEQYNYISLFFIISVSFLLFVYSIDYHSKFNQNILIRTTSKITSTNMNVLVLVIIAFLFVILINTLSVVEGLEKLSLKSSWSEFFIKSNNGSVNVFFNEDSLTSFLDTFSPLNYTFILSILVFLYLLTIGLFYLMVHSFTNKRPISFIITIILMGLNMGLDSINSISKYTFANNIYILTSSSDDFYNHRYLYFRIIYWLLLIIIFYTITLFNNLRKDYVYED